MSPRQSKADDRCDPGAQSPSLDISALSATPAADSGPAFPCQPDGSIGPYRLIQRIGSGGMGEVWLAEQTQPVCRRVALKLIKPGMDSRSVLARFEAERQALAVMDHPNIAKVLDGGLTETGRPFFVMEYVKGVPSTASWAVCSVRSVSAWCIALASPKSMTLGTGLSS